MSNLGFRGIEYIPGKALKPSRVCAGLAECSTSPAYPKKGETGGERIYGKGSLGIKPYKP